MAYQQLSKLNSTVPDEYIPRDDESEHVRWQRDFAAAGVGEIGSEDHLDIDATREAVEFGVVDAGESADDILGPGIVNR
jgi:hypothetical protein